MKKYIICGAIICTIGFGYAFFQNVIEWSFGWDKIPARTFSKKFEGHRFDSLKSVILSASQELENVHRLSNTPAISIAISIDKEIVWSEARGYMDLENKVPADTNTLFRIGSTSKALTSLLVGRLLDENLIHMDSTLQGYTNRFLGSPPITLEQLASHQSGIRNYGVCLCFPIWEYYNTRQFHSIKESIKLFEKDPTLFEPGTGYAYSSYNYTALSHAIEKATDSDFTTLMSHYVFNPLNMNHSHPGWLVSENKASFYEVSKNMFKKAFSVNLSNKIAGGGFVSKPIDLVKAGNALLDTTFIDKETQNYLTKSKIQSDGTVNPGGYAIGWRTQTSSRFLEDKEIRIIHHGGVAVGSQSLLVVFPEYRMTISLLINRGKGDRYALFDYIVPIARPFLEEIEALRNQ